MTSTEAMKNRKSTETSPVPEGAAARKSALRKYFEWIVKVILELFGPTPVPEGGAAGKSTRREYFESIVVTVILALYGTTFAIQAFKIPSSSMEDTLLIGDHLMVDKLAYAPRDPWLGPLLPYQQVQRGDIAVFKYPVDPGTHFVKRVVGVPGDRLRMVNKQLYINGHLADEGYRVHKIARVDQYRDNFSRFNACLGLSGLGGGPARARGEWLAGGSARPLLRHGGQPGPQLRQPLLGFCAAGKHRGQAPVDLLVAGESKRRLPLRFALGTRRRDLENTGANSVQDPLASDVLADSVQRLTSA